MIRDWDQNGDFPIANLDSPNFSWGVGDGFLWADTAFGKVKYINTDPSPMGGNYLNLYSKELAPDWYHFATGINKSGLDDNVDRLPTYNPDSIYLNFYARGNQEYKNTSLELVYNCNESGIYPHAEVNAVFCMSPHQCGFVSFHAALQPSKQYFAGFLDRLL